MWRLSSTFVLTSLLTAAACVAVLSTLSLLRLQQIRLFRSGYYRTKAGLLKSLDWKSFVLGLCAFSAVFAVFSPVFGWASLGIGLLICAGWGKSGQSRLRMQQREGMVSFLSGLEGLLRAGLSFPTAMERLSAVGSSFVQKKVRRAFRKFSKEGTTFGAVLESLPLKQCLGLMERAHRLGLPILPIAMTVRQTLETQDHQEKRVREIRSQAVVNGLVAMSLPWITFGILYWQQPLVFQSMLNSRKFWFLVGGSLFLQAAGLTLVHRISTYANSSQLLNFVQQLHLFTKAGFSLHWSWHSISDPVLSVKGEETVEACLLRLSQSYEGNSQRLWFAMMRELYLEGSNLVPLLESMTHSLEQERQRHLQSFLERLPTRVNGVAILFFFPAFFLLGILPLLFEIMGDL